MGRHKGDGAYTTDQIAWLGSRYMEGYTLEALADFAHLSVTCVYVNLQRNGFVPRRRNLPPLESMREDFERIGRTHGV